MCPIANNYANNVVVCVFVDYGRRHGVREVFYCAFTINDVKVLNAFKFKLQYTWYISDLAVENAADTTTPAAAYAR